jgi:chromosomal replication initiation ATPase DnaA
LARNGRVVTRPARPASSAPSISFDAGFAVVCGIVSPADGSSTLKRQQRLPLEQAQPHDLGSFVPSACNAEARAAVAAFASWPGGKLVLVGPDGSGMTHLATAWAEMVGADRLDLDEAVQLGPEHAGAMLVEHADRRPADEVLFHLIDRADAAHPLLITARTPPRSWTTDLPDLRSRLNALMVVELQSPDDVVLAAVLGRFFRERNIRPRKSVLDYLVKRIERSAPAARAVVERIDEAAAAEGRNITRGLARRVLGVECALEEAQD